jgi:hypothetical protein
VASAAAAEAFLLVWHALAFERVRYLAATMPAFSTDDVWAVLEDLPKPEEPRALGPVMHRARDEQLIRKTDFTTKSLRPACHARPANVWSSIPLDGNLTDAAAYVAKRKATIAPPSLPQPETFEFLRQ